MGQQLDVRVSQGLPWTCTLGAGQSCAFLKVRLGPGGAASKVAHSHSWQAGDGCWQEASVLSVWASHRLLGCPDDMVADFPQAKRDMRKKGGSHNVFYHLFSEITHLHFHHILLATRTNPDTV